MILKSGDKFISDDNIIEIISFKNRRVKVKDNLGEYYLPFVFLKYQIKRGFFLKMEE